MTGERTTCQRGGVERGFTLIELLVVVAIISLLAALLFPAMTSALNKSYDTACRNNLRQLAVGLTTYADDNNGYFPSVSSAGSGGSYFGDQRVLLDALKDVIGEKSSILFCPRSVREEKINIKDYMSQNLIGYFYWAWTLENGYPVPIRPDYAENIWNLQGWNSGLGQLVLMTDHYRDKNFWGQKEDWQYHAGSVETPLSKSGTLAVMGDGSVQLISPRP